MKILNFFFQFYLKSSMHVGLAALCMFEITAIEWSIEPNINLSLFVLFGTISAYNFTKYFNLLQKSISKQSFFLKVIIIVSSLSFCYSIFLFIRLDQLEQFVILLSSILLFLYTIPLSSTRLNFRGITGVKIHIVAICWTFITSFLPLIEHVFLDNRFLWITMIQRYFWVLLATLPFEIYDFRKDPKSLGTIPQTIGVQRTKLLGYVFAIVVFCGTLFNNKTEWEYYSIMLIGYLFFLTTTSRKQSYYRNIFWVEAIPFFLWTLLYLKC